MIIGATQYVAAIFLVPYPRDWPGALADFRLLMLSSSTILVAAAGYIINDYYDVKIDYINKPRRVVVGRFLKRRQVLIAHWIISFSGVALGFALSLSIGLINLAAAILLWLYSMYLKHKPLVGNLLIALLTGMTLVTVAVYFQRNVHLLVNYAIFAFIITLVREIIKDMEDMKGDQRFGSQTLPIIWGVRNTKKLLYVLIVGFAGILFYSAWLLDNSTLNHFLLFLTIPILYLINLLYYADTQRKFLRLSIYCKMVMLAGIMSMIFF
jgi:4-hydroxybenzoate polyprenyltransferase